jgi:hypothetical protein
MKNKRLELNVDFIGGQGALSMDEEKALSDYFQQKKKEAKEQLFQREQNWESENLKQHSSERFAAAGADL